MTVRRLTVSSWTRSPVSLTGRRSPRPISCRFFSADCVSFSVQIWKTFGIIPALAQGGVGEDEAQRHVRDREAAPCPA